MNKGDVIIFHPNLLHGASKNLGIFTRVSLDFRIFNPTLI
jgi:ectoine hydroxylase-related dioxygenase (phytanoyl-CoA dioxygenase family)